MPAVARTRLVVGALAVWASAAAAQGGALSWRPAQPRQGSPIVLEVRPEAGDSVAAVRGVLAGEPLHFEGGPDLFRALGAVPLGAADSIGVRVIIERTGGTSDTLAPLVPVTERHAPREALRTAPRFVQPPESLAARLAAEQRLIQELKHRAHDTPRLWRGRFARPRPGAVTSEFGAERVFNGTVQSRHLGVDFAGKRGTTVRSANRGVVVFVGSLYYSGRTIFVDHGAGLVTAYLHLSRALVRVGDTVHRGQVIGSVGASGRVTGPHLHWLAAYGGISIDPLDLLRLAFPAAEPTPAASLP